MYITKGRTDLNFTKGVELKYLNKGSRAEIYLRNPKTLVSVLHCTLILNLGSPCVL